MSAGELRSASRKTGFSGALALVLGALVVGAGCADTHVAFAPPVARPQCPVVSRSAQHSMDPDAPFRATPPAVAPGKLQIPPIQQITLPNGIRVLLVERHDLPIVALRAAFPQGYFDGNLLTSELFKTGTPSHPRKVLADAYEDLGIVAQTFYDTRSMGIQLESLATNAPAGMALLADVLQNASWVDEHKWGDDYMVIQKAAEQRFHEAWDGWSQHARAVNLSLMSSGSITPRSIRALLENADTYHADVEFHGVVVPSQTLLIVVGDFTAADMAVQLTKYFGGWRRESADRYGVRKPSPVSEPKSRQFVLIDHQADEQVSVGIGAYIPPQPEAFAAMRCMERLLNKLHGRLHRGTRWDTGATYGVGAAFTEYRSFGTFEIASDFEQGAAVSGLSQILAAVEELGKNLTDEEVQPANDTYGARQFRTAEYTTAALSDYVVTMDHEPVSAYVASHYAGCPRATVIMDAVRRWLRPDALQMVVMGNAKRLVPELKAAGFDAPRLEQP